MHLLCNKNKDENKTNNYDNDNKNYDYNNHLISARRTNLIINR